MSEANIATVQSMYAAFGRGEIDTIINGCTSEVVWTAGGRERDFPAFGTFKGQDRVRDFFRAVSDTQEFSEFSPQEYYADRDKVFVLGRYAMTMNRTCLRLRGNCNRRTQRRHEQHERYFHYSPFQTFLRDNGKRRLYPLLLANLQN